MRSFQNESANPLVYEAGNSIGTPFRLKSSMQALSLRAVERSSLCLVQTPKYSSATGSIIWTVCLIRLIFYQLCAVYNPSSFLLASIDLPFLQSSCTLLSFSLRRRPSLNVFIMKQFVCVTETSYAGSSTGGGAAHEESPKSQSRSSTSSRGYVCRKRSSFPRSLHLA